MKRFLLFVLWLVNVIGVTAQITNRDNYDIKPPKDKKKDCGDLLTLLNNAPIEVRFGTQIQGDTVYLIYNDPDLFEEIIRSKADGIAIDLMQRQQYQCDKVSRFPGTWSHRGFLLPPLYRDEIKKRMIVHDGFVFLPVGRIPSAIKPADVEANYMLLNNRNLCTYSNIVNLDYHGWQLLETGLYYDTLSGEKMREKYKELSKSLKFTIPFEKNKAEYNKEDLRPMYDSLRMTDYAIRTISIKAFTSVEGSFERNEKLQQQRATSIVEALQDYQSEKIQSTITTSENWVEFLNDINGTGYSSWMSLSKVEIKEKLKAPATLEKLEPVLRNHRKALIEIELEKRLSYQESNPSELKKYFEQTIAQKNIDEALYLQQIIFFKIDRQETPDQFIHEIEIPQSLEYGSLLINEASFLFDRSYSNVFEAIKTFENLDRLIPGNPKIQYNLCALRLKAWVQTNLLEDRTTLKKDIENLARLKIPDNLIRRLLINYHIILSERYMRERNYVEKDKAVKYIFDTYYKIKLSDADLVNLSKYFSHYSKFDWAKKIIEPRVKSIEASDDLIFYYLGLTIFDKRYSAGPSYRTTMLNAVNGDKLRFCQLFAPISEGGISFQLLDNEFLKKTWCENCQQ
jgi:hypothetical protein